MTMLQPPLCAVDNDPGFGHLKQHIIDATGLAYYLDRDVDLAAQVTRRLAALEIADCKTYLSVLRDGQCGERELDVLIASLTIGETFFFRHREQFDALRDLVFPDLIDRNRQERQLRIWSAGCATGAEPYSLAILLKREFGRQLDGWGVTILGTDINRGFLSQAQRGEFGDWALPGAPEDIKLACFSPSGTQWSIAPEYREWVSFQYHNLVQHPFPSLVNNLFAFDLILCRNVMIYFDREIIGRSIAHFHECLIEGGWLAVGHAEPNVEMFRVFRTVNAPGAVLYQKTAVPAVRSDWCAPIDMPFDHRPPVTPVPVSRSASVPMPEVELPAREMTAWIESRTSRKPVESPVGESATLADVRAQADRGQWHEAERSCHKMLANDPLNAEAHFHRALVLEQMGRHVETEQALRRAIYLNRDYVLAHYYLGLFGLRNKDLLGARRSFRNALRLLDGMADGDVFAAADGLNVAALKQLTQMHLEVLNSL